MLTLLLHGLFVVLVVFVIIKTFEGLVRWILSFFEKRPITIWDIIKVVLFVLLCWLLWRGILVSVPGAAQFHLSLAP